MPNFGSIKEDLSLRVSFPSNLLEFFIEVFNLGGLFSGGSRNPPASIKLFYEAFLFNMEGELLREGIDLSKMILF